MNIQLIVDISQIAAALTVIGGTFFGLMQLTEFRKQRRDAVAGELMRTFMDTEFTFAIARIMNLPDGISLDEMRESGPDIEQSAVLIESTFETIGLLTYERITPMSLVSNLTGGTVILMWRKLEVWIMEIRTNNSNPHDGEWFQWLAEQCMQNKPQSIPAHIKYRDWQS
ncbi:MAG: hypothetical protein KA365_07810 [Arenimonas sp.]|nr:hypothetical protein [Arenimonas sp.]MBP6310532.1 hypothetical protein [Arenimonas sp.]